MRYDFTAHGTIYTHQTNALATHRHVQVIDVGEMVGFPGQVLARVDGENGELYGLTIENFSKFRRKLMRQYQVKSAQGSLTDGPEESSGRFVGRTSFTRDCSTATKRRVTAGITEAGQRWAKLRARMP